MMEDKVTEKWTKERLNEVEDIQQKEGLTAENLVKRAMDKNNPLHELFDWNKDKAAKEYWLQAARILINEIKVVVDSEEIFKYENVSVNVDGSNARIYETRVNILNNKNLRKQVMMSAWEHVKYWQQKYDNYHFSEFQPIYAAIDKVGKEIKKGKNKKGGKL